MPKLVDHDSQRDQLASLSLQPFAVAGFRRATMRELAAGIGVSTGTLYHYFPAKESLFEHMVQTVIAHDVERIGALPRPDGPAERVKKLLLYVERNEERMRHLLFILIDYLRLAQERGTSPLVEAALASYAGALMRYLDLEDRSMADALVMYVDGLLIRRANMPAPPPLRSHAAPIERMLIDYLGRKRGQ